MSLYFYSEHQSPSSQELYDRLAQLRCDGEKLAINKVSSFEPGPNLRIRCGDIVILFADSPGELDIIISRREMFSDCRVILVLPDRDKETIHKGHVLRPRFVDFKDSSQQTLFKVIQNVVAQDKVDCSTEHAH